MYVCVSLYIYVFIFIQLFIYLFIQLFIHSFPYHRSIHSFICWFVDLLVYMFFVRSFLSHHRLHREALKQSATDPKTGLIDVNILATGLSVSDRKRRLDIAKALKTMLQSKGQAPIMDVQRLFEDFRDNSDLVRLSRVMLTVMKRHYLVSVLNSLNIAILNTVTSYL